MAEVNLPIDDLDFVFTTRGLEEWVDGCLRPSLQHSAFLATHGILALNRAIPTHRIAVRFPLNIIEEVKSASGSVEDPFLATWLLRNQPNYIDLRESRRAVEFGRWRNASAAYGLESVLTHGWLNAYDQRFVMLQIFNPLKDQLDASRRILQSVAEPLSAAVKRLIDSRTTSHSSRRSDHPVFSLTSAELCVIELLAKGLSNKEIARHRGVSDATVKTQIARAAIKVGATRRAEIVAATLYLLPSIAQSIIAAR